MPTLISKTGILGGQDTRKKDKIGFPCQGQWLSIITNNTTAK